MVPANKYQCKRRVFIFFLHHVDCTNEHGIGRETFGQLLWQYKLWAITATGIYVPVRGTERKWENDVYY